LRKFETKYEFKIYNFNQYISHYEFEELIYIINLSVYVLNSNNLNMFKFLKIDSILAMKKMEMQVKRMEK